VILVILKYIQFPLSSYLSLVVIIMIYICTTVDAM